MANDATSERTLSSRHVGWMWDGSLLRLKQSRVRFDWDCWAEAEKLLNQSIISVPRDVCLDSVSYFSSSSRHYRQSIASVDPVDLRDIIQQRRISGWRNGARKWSARTAIRRFFSCSTHSSAAERTLKPQWSMSTSEWPRVLTIITLATIEYWSVQTQRYWQFRLKNADFILEWSMGMCTSCIFLVVFSRPSPPSESSSHNIPQISSHRPAISANNSLCQCGCA